MEIKHGFSSFFGDSMVLIFKLLLAIIIGYLKFLKRKLLGERKK